MKFLTLKSMVLVAAFALLGQSCGSAKYGFNKKDKQDTNNNQNFTEEQPKGNVSPNEWRGTDGFWIKGTPGTAEAGATITSTGSCGNKKGELTWTFGDGQTGKGTNVKHPYKKQGTYKIAGECKYTDGTTQKGTITITITPKKSGTNNGSSTQQPNQSPSQSAYRCTNFYYTCR